MKRGRKFQARKRTLALNFYEQISEIHLRCAPSRSIFSGKQCNRVKHRSYNMLHVIAALRAFCSSYGFVCGYLFAMSAK